jgi:hypothetical protein
MRFPILLAAVLLSGGIDAQEKNSRPASQQAKPKILISDKRVKEVLSFLASDELEGRDTPSRGQDKAAEYIAAAFKKAGLKPVMKDGSYFHTYSKPGTVVDANAVKLVLHLGDGEESVKLEPGKDVRVYIAPGRAYEREETDVTVLKEANASARMRRSAARNPVVILVDPQTSALWKAVAGKRRVLSRRRVSRAPVLLVRKGAFPAEEIEHATVEVAASKAVTLELKNVVGRLPGRKHKDEHVMFSAHYDHLGIGLPVRGDGLYNGADDDATGTTAVVVLAEAFARAPNVHDRGLLFVCFSGEEKGMLGSRAFAADPPVALDSIVVNLNIEMVGRPDQIKGKQAWVTGREFSDFEEIAQVGFARAGIELTRFRAASMLFQASDNISLARKGVIAHSISAGSLHVDYHKPSDHVSKIDLPNMTAVIRGLFEAGLEFATREKRPVYNAQGRRALGLDR